MQSPFGRALVKTVAVLNFIVFIGVAAAQARALNAKRFANSRLSVITEEDETTPLLRGITSVLNLKEMDEKRMQTARLTTQPWSDTYWPTTYGGAAWRYADARFPKKKEFKKNYDYFRRTPPLKVSKRLRSPAEKYDALVGDTNWSLTQASWNEGLKRLDEFGQVLEGEGYCHGWAVASYAEPEPKHSVTALSVTGEPILFTPSDLKALLTLSYARNELATDFVGSRCYEENPNTDSVGRTEAEECLTTNPGAWHLSIVNRIAIAQRSFVLDIDFNHEIWNQPVVGYQYSYFNPRTLETSEQLANAAVSAGDFANDKYRSHRSLETAFVVGIRMTVQYASENEPSSSRRPRRSETEAVTYLYDLELAADGRIVGGEWYSKNHPDFLWSPPAGEKPKATAEKADGTLQVWSADGPLPTPLARAALTSSVKTQPVYAIVKGLLNKSISLTHRKKPEAR